MNNRLRFLERIIFQSIFNHIDVYICHISTWNTYSNRSWHRFNSSNNISDISIYCLFVSGSSQATERCFRIICLSSLPTCRISPLFSKNACISRFTLFNGLMGLMMCCSVGLSQTLQYFNSNSEKIMSSPIFCPTIHYPYHTIFLYIGDTFEQYYSQMMHHDFTAMPSSFRSLILLISTIRHSFLLAAVFSFIYRLFMVVWPSTFRAV